MSRALCAAAMALGFAACGQREPGVSVTLTVHVSPLEGPPSVAIARAVVGVTGLTLLPCDTTGAKLWRAVAPLSAAWAHGDHAPAELAPGAMEPVEIDLLTGSAQTIGVLLPFARDYCEAELAFAAEPGQASLRVLGAHLDGGAWLPFELTTQTDRRVRFPVALQLDDVHPAATLELELGPALLPADPAAPEAATRLLDAIAASVRPR